MSRTESVIPDSPIKAARFYIEFVQSQHEEHELMIQLWDKRKKSAEKLIERLEAGETVCCEAI